MTTTPTTVLTGEVDDRDGLTQLPHSGLRVPHTRLMISAYRPLMTGSGLVAFTATLRLDGNPVGTIENDGHGGATWVRFHPGTGFGPADWYAFASRCDPDDEELVAAGLVTEFEIGALIRAAARHGETLCRRMGFIGDGAGGPAGDPFPVEFIERPNPLTPADRAELIAEVDRMPVTAHGWWELWNGDRWEQVTQPAVGAAQH